MATKHYLITGTEHNIRQFKKDYPKGMIVEDNQTKLHVKRTKHYLMDKLCKILLRSEILFGATLEPIFISSVLSDLTWIG